MFVSFGVLMIGEAYVMNDFLQFLASNLPSVIDGSRMRWKLTKNGEFHIRSFYHKLHGSSLVVFPWKDIWKIKVPRRVSFFVWTAYGIGFSQEITCGHWRLHMQARVVTGPPWLAPDLQKIVYIHLLKNIIW